MTQITHEKILALAKFLGVEVGVYDNTGFINCKQKLLDLLEERGVEEIKSKIIENYDTIGLDVGCTYYYITNGCDEVSYFIYTEEEAYKQAYDNIYDQNNDLAYEIFSRTYHKDFIAYFDIERLTEDIVNSQSLVESICPEDGEENSETINGTLYYIYKNY